MTHRINDFEELFACLLPEKGWGGVVLRVVGAARREACQW